MPDHSGMKPAPLSSRDPANGLRSSASADSTPPSLKVAPPTIHTAPSEGCLPSPDTLDQPTPPQRRNGNDEETVWAAEQRVKAERERDSIRGRRDDA